MKRRKTTFVLMSLALCATLCLSTASEASWLVKEKIYPNKTSGKNQVETIEEVETSVRGDKVILRDLPGAIMEGKDLLTEDAYRYRETLYKKLPNSLKNHPARKEGGKAKGKERVKITWAGSEVRTLVDQGAPSNRIDLPIVGDGYTEAEKEKFFEDAERIKDDLFNGQTFAEYLPLFNIYAVFVPSEESGITDRKKIRTALGLYRTPKGSKRAIMIGNSMAASRAVALAPGADYPILMANDDYYGGLGGKYAITTRSKTSGSMVLRHELGHNFGNVGEEYDGGQIYQGANFSRSKNVKWSHWISGSPKVYEIKQLDGAYIWKDLKGSPFKSSFNFPGPQNGEAYEFFLQISTVGLSSPDEIHVYVDGIRADLTGQYTEDRSFFNVEINRSLAVGRHNLEVRENISDGDNVLVFARTYGVPSSTIRDHYHLGAYATFNNYDSHVGYRPTFEGCLMRNMRYGDFCSADRENMWIRFLKVVKIIDDVKITRSETGSVEIEAITPKLNHLSYHWFKVDAFGGETELPQFANLPKFSLQDPPSGAYRLRVKFNTPDVKNYSKDFEATQDFAI